MEKQMKKGSRKNLPPITSLASNKVLTVKILFDFHKTCKAGLFF